MPYHYSDPARASDPHALPDIEVLYIDGDAVDESQAGSGWFSAVGWYWWPCFPGCLPDGDPIGPYDTEAAALADAQDAHSVAADDAE